MNILTDTIIATVSDWLINQYNADWIYSWLESQPAVDAVEVVRCKDCKWCDGFPDPDDIHPNEVGICKITSRLVESDAFCSYGERRNGDG